MPNVQVAGVQKDHFLSFLMRNRATMCILDLWVPNGCPIEPRFVLTVTALQNDTTFAFTKFT